MDFPDHISVTVKIVKEGLYYFISSKHYSFFICHVCKQQNHIYDFAQFQNKGPYPEGMMSEAVLTEMLQ